MVDIVELKKHIENFKVLFVDDEENIRTSSSIFLNKFFNDVTIRNHGVEGLETFKNDPTFDIVMTDIKMPHLDGVTMARKIKEIKPDVIIIFVTASRGDNHIEDGLCESYITKPISYDDIIKLLEMIKSKTV